MLRSDQINDALHAIDELLNLCHSEDSDLPVVLGHDVRKAVGRAGVEITDAQLLLQRFELSGVYPEPGAPEALVSPQAGARRGRDLLLSIIEDRMAVLQMDRTELANALGVSREAVTNTLREGTAVSLERALSYAKALGLRLDEVVDLD